MQGHDLLRQNPALGFALQVHNARKAKSGGQQPQQPQAQPQQAGNQQKIPTPPDIQERMIILTAMAGHLKTLDSVLKPQTPQQPQAQPTQQPQGQAGQIPPQLLAILAAKQQQAGGQPQMPMGGM